MTGNRCFVVWVHRRAQSIFGAASHPVNQDGVLLAFSDKQKAIFQCDSLNAHSGSPQVSYTIEKQELVISGRHTYDQEDVLDLTPDLALELISDIAA